MTDVKLNYKPHYYQRLIHESPARVRVVCAGRRFGKSIMACGEAVKTAISKPKSRIFIIAPTFKLSEENWRILKDITPAILVKETRLADRKMVLITGSEIELKSADTESSLRGAGIDLAILDEASRIKLDSYHAILPALSDRKGKSIIISTPRGKNWFFNEFQKGQDPNNKEYESWRFSSKLNPFFTPGEYDQLKANLPIDVFNSEIEADFIDGAGSVFRNVKGRIGGELEEPRPNETYYIGVDLAKAKDYSCICGLDSKRHLAFFDRFNKMDWMVQRGRILNTAEKYNNASVLVDSTGLGSPILDDLNESANRDSFYGDDNYIHIEGFKFTNQSKNQLISSLQLAIETESITYPNIPVLINELESYAYEILPSGNFRYSAPAGLHDDTVTALALSNYAFEHMEQPRPATIEVIGNMREGWSNW